MSGKSKVTIIWFLLLFLALLLSSLPISLSRSIFMTWCHYFIHWTVNVGENNNTKTEQQLTDQNDPFMKCSILIKMLNVIYCYRRFPLTASVPKNYEFSMQLFISLLTSVQLHTWRMKKCTEFFSFHTQMSLPFVCALRHAHTERARSMAAIHTLQLDTRLIVKWEQPLKFTHARARTRNENRITYTTMYECKWH